jgi:hypothetical protein
MTRDKVEGIMRLIRDTALNGYCLNSSAYSVRVITSNITRYKYKPDNYFENVVTTTEKGKARRGFRVLTTPA